MICNHECMELQQLRYAVALSEERSFTRAAERCFVVQSSLSHQIKALEREVGVDLFARTSRRVEVTAAGEAFVAAARAAVDAADRAAADAVAAAGEIRGSLAIGMIPTATRLDIPAALREFRDLHPSVSVSLRVGGSDVFLSEIASGAVDIAILGLPESTVPTGAAFRELARERHVAVVAPDHRLARRRRLDLADLADEPAIDFPRGTPGRAQSDGAFQAAGVQRSVMYEAMSTGLTLELVRQGLGVALLPPNTIRSEPSIREIPITDGPARVEYLAWSEFNPSPAARAFRSVLDRAAPRSV